MNKKRLSVVMAGAMLATSVAPVLAAEVEKGEYSAAQLGLLKKELRELLESKKFHSTDAKLPGESVYYVTNGLTGAKTKLAGLDTFISNLKVGNKVYVWSEGFRTDEKGNYFSTEDAEGTSVGTYSAADLKESVVEASILDAVNDGKDKENYKFLAQKVLPVKWNKNKFESVPGKVVVVEEGKSVVVKLRTGLEVELNLGEKKVDFKKPIDKDGYKVAVSNTVWDGENDKTKFDNLAKGIVGFAEAKTEAEEGKDISPEKLKEITITTGGYDLAVSDLYDGLMLTEKGHDFLNQIKYYDKVSNGSHNNAVVDTKVVRIPGTDKYTFKITFNKVGSLSPQVYTITGDDEEKAGILRDWLDTRVPKVDILAGSNRYETAVAIAKEQVFGSSKLGNSSLKSNIVLVNGNSLVDGLSAAPLAADLKIHDSNTDVAAPILLTEADALPKATKAYLKELVGNKTVSNLNTTVHLVGGEAVLNKSLEKELKELGFKVVRYGGANREETSLKVAEEINKDLPATTKASAFVVGANGEADAMSIAAVAAKDKTPIVVSKAGGLTEDAIEALNDANVTVIGGKSAVSEEDYEAVKAEAHSLNRISGANRKETNALIIEKYYAGTFGKAQNVIVAKDGQRDKMELVDALAAANMASGKKAPIVLATSSLSSSQINALELNAKEAATLYQVGHGVDKDNVVKTIAQRLGLAK